MIKELFANWIVSLMVILSPIDDANVPTNKYAVETVSERKERYESIASDLADVIYELEQSSDYSWPSPLSREELTAIVVTTAYRESRFRKDVDYGIGPYARGGGVDTCLMQVRVRDNAKTVEGWSATDLVKDRKKCFKAGIRVISDSFRICSKNKVQDRLAMYLSGKCNKATAQSRSRYKTAQALLVKSPPPVLPNRYTPIQSIMIDAST